MYIGICVHQDVYTYICVYIYIRIDAATHILFSDPKVNEEEDRDENVYNCTYIHTHTHQYMHMHTYIYIYTHTHTYTHVRVHLCIH